jgi:hypothetical protein
LDKKRGIKTGLNDYFYFSMFFIHNYTQSDEENFCQRAFCFDPSFGLGMLLKISEKLISNGVLAQKILSFRLLGVEKNKIKISKTLKIFKKCKNS